MTRRTTRTASADDRADTRLRLCPAYPPLTIDAAQSARASRRARKTRNRRNPYTPRSCDRAARISPSRHSPCRCIAGVRGGISRRRRSPCIGIAADGARRRISRRSAGGAPAAVGAYPGPIAALRARLALAIVLAHRDSAALDAKVPVTTVRTGAARLALGPPSRPVLASPVARAPLPLRRPLLPGVLAREGQERVSDPKLEDILEVRPPSGGHPST